MNVQEMALHTGHSVPDLIEELTEQDPGTDWKPITEVPEQLAINYESAPQLFTFEMAQDLWKNIEPFPVDLDEAWEWLGYSRKDSAVDSLKAFFEEGLDFSGYSRRSEAGRTCKSYRLTVDCFKEMGMIARTPQGKQIRKYFLECESIAKAAMMSPRISCNDKAALILMIADSTTGGDYQTRINTINALINNI